MLLQTARVSGLAGGLVRGLSRWRMPRSVHDPGKTVLGAVLAFFRPRAVGAFICGSAARGGMDQESDLDIGIVLPDAAGRDAAWAQRWDWGIAAWFHRFDADHVKPYFVIYLYEPRIKADIALYAPDLLPPAAGGPYAVAWDDTGRLDEWAQSAVPLAQSVDWSPAVHEEERFWAWVVYCVQHVQRGEYYRRLLGVVA
jgi:predicted nucleotidyltransferase